MNGAVQQGPYGSVGQLGQRAVATERKSPVDLACEQTMQALVELHSKLDSLTVRLRSVLEDRPDKEAPPSPVPNVTLLVHHLDQQREVVGRAISRLASLLDRLQL